MIKLLPADVLFFQGKHSGLHHIVASA